MVGSFCYCSLLRGRFPSCHMSFSACGAALYVSHLSQRVFCLRSGIIRLTLFHRFFNLRSGMYASHLFHSAVRVWPRPLFVAVYCVMGSVPVKADIF